MPAICFITSRRLLQEVRR
ncbi:hypothetical protein E2C01_087617 [Portunus trituberculatus]|uniref:Uncharacterized protein n=1 Tax=Portunus trituberculatus TaxID=210409 RepID=A0A5B7JJT6_PORTR|nr:hypothetical protein [Portunus trituberculatus]